MANRDLEEEPSAWGSA